MASPADRAIRYTPYGCAASLPDAAEHIFTIVKKK